MRLIDADALIAEMHNVILEDGEDRRIFYEVIERQPTIEERKKGKWIAVTNGRGGHECDKCHNYAPAWQTGEERLTDFCPNCGADMRGEDDETD